MFRTLVGAATALLLYAGVLTAQNFPERELLGVIMWGAGGATDVVARGVTPAVEEALGNPIGAAQPSANPAGPTWKPKPTSRPT